MMKCWHAQQMYDVISVYYVDRLTLQTPPFTGPFPA